MQLQKIKDTSLGADLAPTKCGLVLTQNNNALWYALYILQNPLSYYYPHKLAEYQSDYISGMSSLITPLREKFDFRVVVEEPIYHSKHTTVFAFQWLIFGAFCSWLSISKFPYHTIQNTIAKSLAGDKNADKEYMRLSAIRCGFKSLNNIKMSKDKIYDLADGYWISGCKPDLFLIDNTK